MVIRIAALVLLAMTLGCGEGERRLVRLHGYNLLFVTIDTMRADRLDSTLTPRLHELARQGVSFDHVLSHVPLTLPAHASLFTATLPTRHGVHDNGTFRLDGARETLAAALKRSSYETAAFVGAFVLDARFGLNQGFDRYDDYYGEKRAYASFTEVERKSDAVLSAARAWLEPRASATDGKWFAWIHLFDPHAPYEPPEPFASRYRDDPYGGEVAYVDHQLGAFLDELEERKLLDRTLVVVAGDHGESLGEHGELTHGTFAYNATLAVPLILWARGMPPTRFQPRIGQVDVMPTVLDLLGIAPPSGIDGRSLLPFLYQGASYQPRDTYFEALNPHLTRNWAPLRGVVSGRHKLIDLPLAELYDLENDPGEQRNLASDRAAIASDLRAVLERFTEGSAAPVALDVDEETERRLLSLGYVVAPRAGSDGRGYTERDDPKRLVSINNDHDRAGELFRDGRTDEAIALLRRLLDQQPGSSFAYQKLAYALHQLGRTSEAVGVLETGLANDVSDLSLQALLGSYWIEVGEHAKALVLLENVVERYPEFAEAHNILGVAYSRSGRYEEAGRRFEKVLELDPSSASTRSNLGALALSKGDLAAARDYFVSALDADPELASARNGLGVLQARSGDLGAAAESWRRAVELDPLQFDALFNLAMALTEIAPSEARPYLERFVREAPPARYRADIEMARALLERGS